MAPLNICVFAVIIIQHYFQSTSAHGMLMDPVNRGSAGRKGFRNERNWNDMGNNCGGLAKHSVVNKGNCGPCGDDYSLPQPRPNEKGGRYSRKGVTVRKYFAGQKIIATVRVTAPHNGYFEFSLCPLNKHQPIETEECFNRHPVYTIDGKKRWYGPMSKAGDYRVKLRLPKNLVCDNCSFRWHWTAAQNKNVCADDGVERFGCGTQEVFRTCSDIKIQKGI